MTLAEFDVQMARLKKCFFAESVYTPDVEKKLFAALKQHRDADFSEAVGMLCQVKKAAPLLYEMQWALSRVMHNPLPKQPDEFNPRSADFARESIELLKKRSS